jgi:hypothetical protein
MTLPESHATGQTQQAHQCETHDSITSGSLHLHAAGQLRSPQIDARDNIMSTSPSNNKGARFYLCSGSAGGFNLPFRQQTS